MNSLFSSDFLEDLYKWTDIILFFVYGSTVLYLFIFMLLSFKKKKTIYPPAKVKSKFAILYLLQHADEVIIENIKKSQEQNYPSDRYTFFALANSLPSSFISQLESLSVKVIITPSANTSFELVRDWVAAYKFPKSDYEVVVLLDGNNYIEQNYLDSLNDAIYGGCYVIQTHRVPQRYTSNISYLRTVSEEINNVIFRKGHSHVSLSSALNDSGIAIEMQALLPCVKNNKLRLSLVKRFEKILMERYYYVEYLDEVCTFTNDYNQNPPQKKQKYERKTYGFFSKLGHLVMAILDSNMDYFNKMFQWLLPSRFILLFSILFWGVLVSYIESYMGYKWFGLFVVLFLSFAMAIPRHLVSKKLLGAIFLAPFELLFRPFTHLFKRKKA